VITEKADVVTGELELLTHPSEAADDGLEVLVRYVGAEEWYTISGSPVPGGDDDHHALHEEVLVRTRLG
jgi:hypothetical protein